MLIAMRMRARSFELSGVNDGPGSTSSKIWRDSARFDDAEPVVVEHRHFAERMAGYVLGLARLALEHVHRHLFVMRAFLGEQHPDRPDIRTAVETVEDDPSHFIPFRLDFARPRFQCGEAAVAPPLELHALQHLEVFTLSSVIDLLARRHKCSSCSNQYSSMRNSEWTSLARLTSLC